MKISLKDILVCMSIIMISSCNSKAQTTTYLLQELNEHLHETSIGECPICSGFDSYYKISIYKDSLIFKHKEYANRVSLKNSYLTMDTVTIENVVKYYVLVNCKGLNDNCFKFTYDLPTSADENVAVEFLATFYFLNPYDAQKAFVLISEIQAKVNHNKGILED